MKFPNWLRVYGDIEYREACDHEDVEMVTFFNELEARHPMISALTFHPKNEGKRTNGQARWDKAKGLKKGVADIITVGQTTFVCELKRRDHTKSQWQSGQIEFLQNAQSGGAFVCVALGWENAIRALEDWRKATTSFVNPI